MDVQLIHPLFDDELYHKQAFLLKNQDLRTINFEIFLNQIEVFGTELFQVNVFHYLQHKDDDQKFY